MKKRITIIVAVMLVIGLGYLVYFLFAHSESNALTVSDLRSQVQSLRGQQVIVKGQVSPGTINWDDRAKVMTFVLNDDIDSLTVVYSGIAPDDFKPGVELVVEGTFSSDGVFKARSFSQPRSVCALCH